MIITSRVVLILAVLGTVSVYLFVSAPPPLVEGDSTLRRIPIEVALELLQDENAIAREIYTRDIVAAGKERGIKFDEDWQNRDVHAGPLPAQFLRETARGLERSRVQLGLYLVSDYAINKANNVEGQQLQLLRQVRDTRQPRMLYVADAGRFAYMFPDVAVVESCVECHNKHPEGTKTDWKLDDVMGATTWTYPDASVSLETFFELLATLRTAIAEAYQTVLDEVAELPEPPAAGEQWPKDGYSLPSKTVFREYLASRASGPILGKLTQFLHPESPAHPQRASTP